VYDKLPVAFVEKPPVLEITVGESDCAFTYVVLKRIISKPKILSIAFSFCSEKLWNS
jgi:hypothetical protein